MSNFSKKITRNLNYPILSNLIQIKSIVNLVMRWRLMRDFQIPILKGARSLLLTSKTKRANAWMVQFSLISLIVISWKTCEHLIFFCPQVYLMMVWTRLFRLNSKSMYIYQERNTTRNHLQHLLISYCQQLLQNQ